MWSPSEKMISFFFSNSFASLCSGNNSSNYSNNDKKKHSTKWLLCLHFHFTDFTIAFVELFTQSTERTNQKKNQKHYKAKRQSTPLLQVIIAVCFVERIVLIGLDQSAQSEQRKNKHATWYKNRTGLLAKKKKLDVKHSDVGADKMHSSLSFFSLEMTVSISLVFQFFCALLMCLMVLPHPNTGHFLSHRVTPRHAGTSARQAACYSALFTEDGCIKQSVSFPSSRPHTSCLPLGCPRQICDCTKNF